MGHNFLIAAYVITWALQLGYAGWLLARWARLNNMEKRRER